MDDCSHCLVCLHVPPALRAPDKLEDWLIRELGSAASSVQCCRWHDESTCILVFTAPSAASSALLKLGGVGPCGMLFLACDAALKHTHELRAGPLPAACRPDMDAAVVSRFIRAAIGGNSRRGADTAAATPASSQAAFLKPANDYFIKPTSRADASSSWRGASVQRAPPPTIDSGALTPSDAGGDALMSWRSGCVSSSGSGSGSSSFSSSKHGGAARTGGSWEDVDVDAAAATMLRRDGAPLPAAAAPVGSGCSGVVMRGRGHAAGDSASAREGVADDDADWGARKDGAGEPRRGAEATKPSSHGGPGKEGERKRGGAAPPVSGAAARMLASSGLKLRK